MVMATGNQRIRRAQKMRRLYEAAQRDGTPDRFYDDFSTALETGERKPEDFSIRAIFENFVADGREIVDSWNPQHGGGSSGVMLHEAGSAVSTTDFTNITGQIVFSSVLEAYNDPMYLADTLAPPRDTQYDGEKIPGIGRIGDEAVVIGEGQTYPRAGVSEEWIETPRTTKRGFIVPVTKEAIFFDRTGLVLERAAEVTTWLAVSKEKRVLDECLGITNSYNYNGTDIDTYGDDSGSHNWDNLQATNGLEDWTDIENALLLFDGMTDPTTGEPVDVLGALHLVVPSALLMTALRIVGATEVREVTNTNTTSLSANPLSRQLASGGRPFQIQIHSSAYVQNRTSSTTTWFIGDFPRAFRYGQNWPITSVTAPPSSHDEFHNDIVQQFKVSERGAPETHRPRRVVKCTA